jgi:hypothetical protein
VFLKELKCNLQSGEFVVLCDFAENFYFVLQDEAQGFHWNKAQATIHPFVFYFKKSDALNTEHENLVMISDCLKHDSILVHTFQRHLMKFIENTFESPINRIVYFCDGSAAQYKNRRNLLNITSHSEDTKKQQINKKLYLSHLYNAKYWQNSWFHIEQCITNKLQVEIQKKIRNQKEKLNSY